jgi:deoxyxylulose-5-phosphate synthase
MAYLAMEGAERLAELGLETTVVNARFMRPIDHALLTSCLSEHTVLFTLEEHALHGGLGATVLEIAARDRLGAGNILPIALRDDALLSGSRPGLLKAFGMDVAGLTDRMLVEYRRFVRSGSR